MSAYTASRECPTPRVSTPPYTCIQGTHLSACVCVGSVSLVSLCLDTHTHGGGMV